MAVDSTRGIAEPSLAVVTGVSQGLGLELTKGLLARGWTVLGVVRETRSSLDLQAEYPDALELICGDLRDEQTSVLLTSELVRRRQAVRLLINNAGNTGSGKSIREVDISEVADMLDVHCLAPIRCVQVVLPYLQRAGDPAVVNVNSRMGSVSTVAAGSLDHLSVSYSMRIAKAAQNMLTACLAREFSSEELRVYSVHPGRLTTRMGSADADMTAAQGAARMLAWLLDCHERPESGYYEPGKGRLGY